MPTADPSSLASHAQPDWDSITKEDLEFSVGSKQAVWEVKDPLLGSEVDVLDSSATHGSYHGASPSRLTPSNGAPGYSQGPGAGYGQAKGGMGYPPNGQYGY